MRTASLALAAALCCMAGVVEAHSALVRAEPGPRSVLAEPPAMIRLWFNEPVEAKFSTVTVEGADGKTVANIGDPVAVTDNERELVVRLPALAPGKYRVRYRVLSVDGHVVDWGYGFSVAPPARKP